MSRFAHIPKGSRVALDTADSPAELDEKIKARERREQVQLVPDRTTDERLDAIERQMKRTADAIERFHNFLQGLAR